MKRQFNRSSERPNTQPNKERIFKRKAGEDSVSPVSVVRNNKGSTSPALKSKSKLCRHKRFDSCIFNCIHDNGGGFRNGEWIVKWCWDCGAFKAPLDKRWRLVGKRTIE